jgi:hypothetical protein
MKCLIPGHESFDSVGVCLNLECTQKSRLVCPKCLLNIHNMHSDNIVLFGDVLETKLNDIEYLTSISEVKDFLENMDECIKRRDSFDQMNKNIEVKASIIYDFLLSNFENLNNNVKKIIENAFNIVNGNSETLLKSLQEENNLYNNTSMLTFNQLSPSEYETVVTNSVISKLKEIRQSQNNAKTKLHSQNIIRDNNVIESKLNDFYNSFKADLATLFKRYNEKVYGVTTKTTVEFIPNNFCRTNLNVSLEQIFEKGRYVAQNKQLCLIGVRPLLAYEKWKIRFENVVCLSCIGFGIASLDDPKIHDSLSSNKNNCLLCLCCNGPWNTSAMKILIPSTKLSNVLKSNSVKEITFEFNRGEDKYKVYDPFGNVHSEFSISQIQYQDNIVPIINCTAGVSVSFSIIV